VEIVENRKRQLLTLSTQMCVSFIIHGPVHDGNTSIRKIE